MGHRDWQSGGAELRRQPADRVKSRRRLQLCVCTGAAQDPDHPAQLRERLAAHRLDGLQRLPLHHLLGRGPSADHSAWVVPAAGWGELSAQWIR